MSACDPRWYMYVSSDSRAGSKHWGKKKKKKLMLHSASEALILHVTNPVLFFSDNFKGSHSELSRCGFYVMLRLNQDERQGASPQPDYNLITSTAKRGSFHMAVWCINFVCCTVSLPVTRHSWQVTNDVNCSRWICQSISSQAGYQNAERVDGDEAGLCFPVLWAIDAWRCYQRVSVELTHSWHCL